eukprot:CAMPEP_0114516640 /NCGR_PEP_ID=MMETSP0109-20121206/17439_1 /TAXON_ID=29199 /ORGANISM="Chlorarachnion reptans, Strain CCCM449" /LENGTH=457 /DNA_ID=CAMNT_0001697049 /DNA_START=963 /DNA_END=2336 /DNA_ORIENTATION=-
MDRSPLPLLAMMALQGILLVLPTGARAAYNPNADYEELMDSIDAHPKAHTYDGSGKLGEMTLYELQDFAETLDDPDARDKVEQFASSMEMMLKMMDKDPVTTRLGDLRRMAAEGKQEAGEESLKDNLRNGGLSDQSLDDALKSMMSGDPSQYMEQVKPLLKSLGLGEDALDEEKLKEMMSPEKIHEMSQQMLKNLGMLGGGGAGKDLFNSLLGMDGLGEEAETYEDGEFIYEEWLEGLPEKDQKSLNRFLQGEIPQSLDELKQIKKAEFNSVMSPLSANRIWRHIHLGSKKKRRRKGAMDSFTNELAEMMEAVEKNPRMKEYSQKFLESLTSGGGGGSMHEEILKLTKEMQDDPDVKKLTEKFKKQAPAHPNLGLDHLQDTFSKVKDTDFKEMLEQMAKMGLPGLDKGMLSKLHDVDMKALRDEYGIMMEGLLAGKDISALELPIMDSLMNRFHDDL